MKVELALEPTQSDLQTISQGIQAFNQTHMPDNVVFEPDLRFAVFARNHTNEVIGGIRANAYWNYCTIELLWLSEQARGKGVGSQLITQTEAYARTKGIGYIRTETLDFQAKGFYQKHGYTLFGELPNHPKGHTTYCLMKQLNELSHA